MTILEVIHPTDNFFPGKLFGIHLELPGNALYAITKNINMCHMIVKKHKISITG